jgi:hypothetical protein
VKAKRLKMEVPAIRLSTPAASIPAMPWWVAMDTPCASTMAWPAQPRWWQLVRSQTGRWASTERRVIAASGLADPFVFSGSSAP